MDMETHFLSRIPFNSYTLVISLFFLLLLFSRRILAQTTTEREKIDILNADIQGYAFKAFRHPRTGIIYNVDLPDTLTGVKAQAVRLRSGSLRRRGFVFNEFNIPVGGVVDGNPRSVVLVYRNFTMDVYNHEGYTYVGPIVGIKVYIANLSSTEALPELGFTATGNNITVRIPFARTAPGITPYCATFDSNANIVVSNISSTPNVCYTKHLGDYALVIPSLAPSPSPSPAPAPVASAPVPSPAFLAPALAPSIGPSGKRSNTWKIAVGVVVGGVALIGLAGFLGFAVLRYAQSAKFKEMEHSADYGEVLQTAPIGSSRAPTAGFSRTKPVLEADYVT